VLFGGNFVTDKKNNANKQEGTKEQTLQPSKLTTAASKPLEKRDGDKMKPRKKPSNVH